jgi:hypothetical protein
MVFNVTFNNILVISWQSLLLMVEYRENHRLVNPTTIRKWPRLSPILNLKVYRKIWNKTYYLKKKNNSGILWRILYISIYTKKCKNKVNNATYVLSKGILYIHIRIFLYNYLCNQCLSPLKLVCILLMVRCTQYNIMW